MKFYVLILFFSFSLQTSHASEDCMSNLSIFAEYYKVIMILHMNHG